MICCSSRNTVITQLLADLPRSPINWREKNDRTRRAYRMARSGTVFRCPYVQYEGSCATDWDCCANVARMGTPVRSSLAGKSWQRLSLILRARYRADPLAERTRRLRHVNQPGYRPFSPVSYTHLRAHETRHDLVC